MATFDLSNSAGFGFNMSGTTDSGWAFVTADPNVTTQLRFDNGDWAIFDVYGSTVFDTLGVDYWTDGYNVQVTEIVYAKDAGNTVVLDIAGLNLWTTVADLAGSAWLVRLNNGNDTFFGNDYRDIIRGGYGDDVLVGYADNDDLHGDAGNDWLNGGYGYDLLDGGDGYDTAFFVGTSTNFSLSRNPDGSVTAVDMTTGVSDVLYSIEALTFDNGTFSTDSLLPPLPPPDPFVGTDGNNSIWGNASNNTLRGLGGNDILRGAAGNDVLFGGTGNDTMAGGAGKDAFVFDTKPNKYSNHDTITDFRVVDDTIRLDNAVYTKVGVNGWLKPDAFFANLTGKAHDRSDRIIYETDSGKLFYDPDGTGSATAVHFATVSKNLALTNKDFYII